MHYSSQHQIFSAGWFARLPWKPVLQRLPGVWLLCMIPFAILGPVYTPVLFAIYYWVLHLLFLANNLRSAYGVHVAYHSAREHSVTDWLSKYMETTGAMNGDDSRLDLPFDRVMHVIIIPNYKEDMDTLCETLDILASHSRALTQYKVCMAMEESEADCDKKAAVLMDMYCDSFYEICHTVHPMRLPGEMRGKSSNVAWASSQMALRNGGLEGRHDHEVLTIMDADTAFAEDYFLAVAYNYTIAKPSERKIMMFTPCTVFDRNAHQVPVFVRVTDMFWSIGVLSNLYHESTVKIPSSAYSVAMDLAIAVNFWDAGPEAIGEDMHMYLKCFFATDGKLINKSIFSPASQCNVSGSGTGVRGWVSGIKARYQQAQRHLWGSLDTGYVLRKSIQTKLDPSMAEVIPAARRLQGDDKSQAKKDEKHEFGISGTHLLTLIHRLIESHILMGHLFLLMTIASIMLPASHALYYPFATWIWSHVSSDPLDSWVVWSVDVSFWTRVACLIPNLSMIYFYEKYHQWVGFQRWELSASGEAVELDLPSAKASSVNRRVDSAKSMKDLTLPLNALPKPSYSPAFVTPLGMRSSLYSPRMLPSSLVDWIAIALSGFMFYVLPQFHSQVCHLFTDSLEYKVAAKPQLSSNSSGVPVAAATTTTTTTTTTRTTTITTIKQGTAVPSLISAQESREIMMLPFGMRSLKTTCPPSELDCEGEAEVKSISSKGDEGYFDDLEDGSSNSGNGTPVVGITPELPVDASHLVSIHA